ncbi:MAG TPA: hypothetical protein VHM26_05090, partial [Chitinophagaceae bacterium]|nr:hypothetical protein [Chitinophagaceae bacterium]
MKKTLLLLLSLPFVKLYAQPSQATIDSIRKLTNEDYKQMLAQLNISSIRPGVNGNDPKAANAANYDETKANPYPALPNALRFKHGDSITSLKMWYMRRNEIKEDFDKEVYGRMPEQTPGVKWELINTSLQLNGDIPVIVRQLVGRVDNSSFPSVKVEMQLTIGTPANTKQPVPV